MFKECAFCTFAVKAMMQSGNMQVYFPASLRQNKNNTSEQDDKQATTPAPAPATSSTTESATTTAAPGSSQDLNYFIIL
jgi:hypothetical protein